MKVRSKRLLKSVFLRLLRLRWLHYFTILIHISTY